VSEVRLLRRGNETEKEKRRVVRRQWVGLQLAGKRRTCRGNVRGGGRVRVRETDAQVSKVFATGSAPTSPRATQNRWELRFDRGGFHPL
jgi:hypothetical protein